MAIVTISRQVGSMGDEIADQVCRDLGIRLVGGDHFQAKAQECDDDFAKECRAFETEEPAGFFERIFMRHPANTSLFASLVYSEAAQGDAVVLGRGSQIVLAEDPAVLKVRIVSPRHVRVERLAQRKGISSDDAATYLNRHDRHRRALIESIFHKDLSDWSLYDMVLNTKDLSADLVAKLICLAAETEGPISQEQKASYADRALAKAVEAAIKKKVVTVPVREVEVTSQGNGRLSLDGAVQDDDSRKHAGDIALAHPGVTAVDNQLRVTKLGI
ncbi:MAG: cytidylate kinase family protein [Desulfarculaceae bacterium]|nr:cytidylate kinase family protein [Desulfarculaceae bacterium]MCF8073959.1 cytidylate kinase family protein [Desulfarculaceae bacterium]MCF8102645.1 cytidylate kinase family protein [Desulfarculaceae bacterium]MCF8116114.1 cytidylate kinase family protein [Desulfarculaceae bacterium]